MCCSIVSAATFLCQHREDPIVTLDILPFSLTRVPNEGQGCHKPGVTKQLPNLTLIHKFFPGETIVITGATSSCGHSCCLIEGGLFVQILRFHSELLRPLTLHPLTLSEGVIVVVTLVPQMSASFIPAKLFNALRA